jgi:hypothetical protein
MGTPHALHKPQETIKGAAHVSAGHLWVYCSLHAFVCSVLLTTMALAIRMPAGALLCPLSAHMQEHRCPSAC